MKNDDSQLLNDIYQNCQMGIHAIPQLLKITKNEPFKNALDIQLTEYQKIAGRAENMMKTRHEKPEDISGMARLSSYLMTEMKTMKDSSVSHMAEMMIQGNTMGMTAIMRRMGEHPHADRNVTDLAEDLLATEVRNIRDMKQFL